ncbi:MAG TPA: GNAT family protein [Actinomycetota bacterium]
MNFSVRALTLEDAEAISGWRYPPPYDVYDVPNDPGQDADLGEPSGWGSWWFAVDDDASDLAGYLELHQIGDEVEIGLGMRPDATGQGLGASFVEAALDFARARWSPGSFGLDVFPWNERAIRTYERAGFARGDVYVRTFEDGNEVTFLRMSRPA